MKFAQGLTILFRPYALQSACMAMPLFPSFFFFLLPDGISATLSEARSSFAVIFVFFLFCRPPCLSRLGRFGFFFKLKVEIFARTAFFGSALPCAFSSSSFFYRRALHPYEDLL